MKASKEISILVDLGRPIGEDEPVPTIPRPARVENVVGTAGSLDIVLHVPTKMTILSPEYCENYWRRELLA